MNVIERIDTLARERNQPREQVEAAYVTEAMMRRVAASDLGRELLMRGGKLWLVYGGDVIRPTVDTDVVSTTRLFVKTDEKVGDLFREIMGRDMGDGLHVTDIKVSSLSETPGVRISLQATLDGRPVRGELDLANGSAPPIGARVVDYPLMFPDQNTGFQVMAHPWEVSFAEKYACLCEAAGASAIHIKHMVDLVRMIETVELDPDLIRQAFDWAAQQRRIDRAETFDDLMLEDKAVEKAFAGHVMRMTGRKATAIEFKGALERLRAYLEEIGLVGLEPAFRPGR